MVWNHLNLRAAYAFAEVHGTQGLDDEIKRMRCFTWDKARPPERRGLTVEIFQKHQMWEELLAGSCGKGKSHFKCNPSPSVIQSIIDTVYLPLSRDWKRRHPQEWSEIQDCN